MPSVLIFWHEHNLQTTRRSKVKSFLCSVFLFLLLVSPLQAGPETTIKLATQDFSPFSYLLDPNAKLTDQTVGGPGADIIKRVCSEMNVDYMLKVLPWRRAQYDCREAGIYDGLFLIGWNKKRTEWLHFSPPILQTEYGFFVAGNNKLTFKNVADIKGYRVGVFGPSNTSRSLEKLLFKGGGKFTIDMRPDDISGFKKLSIGRVEAVFSNRDVGFAILKREGIKNVRYAGRQRQLNYYIGFAKKNIDKSVVDEFNSTFLKLHKEKVVHKILDKYQMQPAVIDEKKTP